MTAAVASIAATEHCGARDLAVVRGKIRCCRCGHRTTVNGVPPTATRDLMTARPHAAAVIAVRELVDRSRARHLLPVHDEEA
jgi:hypothetical protein